MQTTFDHRLSIAPMVERTDRHFRYMMRLLCPNLVLYTEMISDTALLHGPYQRLLQREPIDQPTVLQLASGNPQKAAEALRLIEAERPYEAYNLNVGCPSPRVQKAYYGACLMNDPQRVAEIVHALREETQREISIKHRIGVRPRPDIKGRESYQELLDFVDTVEKAGIRTLIVHARIAILDGYSPRKNLTAPPLDYEKVYRLKRDRPSLRIVLNGGLRDTDSILESLKELDGVMIGRAAYENPWFIAQLSRRLGIDHAPCPSLEELLESLRKYALLEESRKEKLHTLCGHISKLFHGQKNARRLRQLLSSQEPVSARLGSALLELSKTKNP